MLEMTDETSNDESDNIVEETISSIADCEKELNNEDKSTSDSSIRPMYSLILTPTRELAMQVTQHITSICKYTSIKVCLGTFDNYLQCNINFFLFFLLL